MVYLLIIYNEIGDNYFGEGILKRDILKVRVVSSKEKKQKEYGENDVEYMSLIYGRGFTSREDIMKNFVYLNGKRIKLAGWKTNKVYTIMKYINFPIGYVYIKEGNDVQFNTGNIHARKGFYLVCIKNEDGSLDRENCFILDGDYFNRMVERNLIKSRQLKAKNKINKQRFIITHRIADGSKLVGYCVRDNKSREAKLNMSNIARLIKVGKIKNAKIINNRIVGNGEVLSKLPIIRLNK